MSLTQIGTRIRSVRQSLNLSQRAVAEKCGISAPYLNLIEHNKRGISGQKLAAIANALNVDVSDLSDGLETALIDRVKKAAKAVGNLRVEVEQTDVFAAQYPGFARLIARQQDRSDEQELDFASLTDQMQNDPYFNQAIHMMLSSITTIRSTAEILADASDMDQGQSRKFTDNMRSEAVRLSQTANDILGHYEPSSNSATSTDISAFEALLERQNHFISDLETDTAHRKPILTPDGLGAREQDHFLASLQSYAQMAAGLPIADFLTKARELQFNPILLAQHFQTSLEAVFFRLAHLPIDQDTPRFALLQVDGAGAVMYRKQLAGFALPRFGGACPLWPIYRSLAHPAQPLAAMLNMPFGERVFSVSTAYATTASTIGMPAPQEAVMIATGDYDLLDPHLTQHAPSLDVGLQCTLCPRLECSSRRSDYLLHD